MNVDVNQFRISALILNSIYDQTIGKILNEPVISTTQL